jgi:esterase/lipase superfamily enzyme
MILRAASIRSASLASAMALGLGACAGFGPPSDPPETPWQYTNYEVLYATDRAPTGNSDPTQYFGAGRGILRYGVSTVRLPTVIPKEALAEAKRRGEKFDVYKYFSIRRLNALEDGAFFEQIRAATTGATPNDVLVYVHGYLNDFRDALFRAAQLKHEIEFPGPVIAYSWPSRGEASAYTVDEANVEWSAHNLRVFLERLVASRGERARVHVLAHSMGNRALAQALREAACHGINLRLHQVVLAAPDIDADVFTRDFAPLIRRSAHRVTLYVSREDKALKASRTVHGHNRAGERRLLSPHFDTVDATPLAGGKLDLAHSYFAEAKPVLLDLKRLLLFNAPPGSRELKQRGGAGGHYWTFE